MNKNKDEYNRLSHLMELLLSDRFSCGISVREISLNLKVPTEVAARDMYAVMGNKHIRDCMALTCGKDTDEWRAALKEGKTWAIETPVKIVMDMFVPEDAGDVVAMRLSPFERSIFAEVPGVSLTYDPVWIKEPAFAGKVEAGEVPGPLQIAAEKGHPVTFAYTEDGKTQIIERFIPDRIYMDPFEKNVYLAGGCEGEMPVLKRIDLIKDIKVHYGEKVKHKKKVGHAFLDYLWGADIEPGETEGEMPGESDARLQLQGKYVGEGSVVRHAMSEKSEETTKEQQPGGVRVVDGYAVRHVKLKIYKETGNLYEKIKTETNGRRFGRLYDDPTKDDVAYYEDEVCGMGSFKSWLLGYGASVYVLEPKDLAGEMYDIAVRRLQMYEEGE